MSGDVHLKPTSDSQTPRRLFWPGSRPISSILGATRVTCGLWSPILGQFARNEEYTVHDPGQTSVRLHLMTIKDLVPFDFVLRAYTAFFHCFEFSSFNASFVDVLFGFTRKIQPSYSLDPRIRVPLSALSLASFALSSLRLSSPPPNRPYPRLLNSRRCTHEFGTRNKS